MIVISNTLVHETHADVLEQQQIGDLIGDNKRENLKIEKIALNHSCLKMPNGIIGFDTIHQYDITLIDGELIYKISGKPDDLPIFYLINPYLIKPDYKLSIQDESYEILGAPDFKDIIVFAILTFKDKLEDTTCNLLGPILINNNSGVALQVINDSNEWGTKHLLSTGEKIIEASFITNSDDY